MEFTREDEGVMLGELLVGGWLIQSCLIVSEVVWQEEISVEKLATECPVSYQVERSFPRIRSKK